MAPFPASDPRPTQTPHGSLHVCIDARLPPGGGHGGVEQFVFGLARGLLALNAPDLALSFLVSPESAEWFRQTVSPEARLIGAAASDGSKRVPIAPGPLRKQRSGRRMKQFLKARFPGLAELLQQLPAPWRKPFLPVPSDGTIERAGVQVMHFTMQGGFTTDVPSIYQPHDLQHLHLPHLFSRRARQARDARYPEYCRRAAAIAVVSSWTKRDLIEHYRLRPDTIHVIPYAPPVSEYPVPTDAEIAAFRARHHLPDRFVFYAAQTFRHKNHTGLIDALSLLNARGIHVPFVSSGKRNDFFTTIQKHMQRTGTASQCTFLGFVSPLELQCLYRLCTAVVIPSKFEAASFPMWEAFLAGAPVASSNVTSLPEQAGDAALIFDPDRPETIAACIEQLWTDDGLRSTLVERGHRNVARLSWDRTARHFAALYRRTGGRPLSPQDQAILDAQPLL